MDGRKMPDLVKVAQREARIPYDVAPQAPRVPRLTNAERAAGAALTVVAYAMLAVSLSAVIGAFVSLASGGRMLHEEGMLCSMLHGTPQLWEYVSEHIRDIAWVAIAAGSALAIVSAGVIRRRGWALHGLKVSTLAMMVATGFMSIGFIVSLLRSDAEGPLCCTALGVFCIAATACLVVALRLLRKPSVEKQFAAPAPGEADRPRIMSGAVVAQPAIAQDGYVPAYADDEDDE